MNHRSINQWASVHSLGWNDQQYIGMLMDVVFFGPNMVFIKSPWLGNPRTKYIGCFPIHV